MDEWKRERLAWRDGRPSLFEKAQKKRKLWLRGVLNSLSYFLALLNKSRRIAVSAVALHKARMCIFHFGFGSFLLVTDRFSL
jgi:hypothetical protein